MLLCCTVGYKWVTVNLQWFLFIYLFFSFYIIVANYLRETFVFNRISSLFLFLDRHSPAVALYVFKYLSYYYCVNFPIPNTEAHRC